MHRSTRFHVCCCIGYSLFCLVWKSIAGRVLTWDHVHYHIYVAHAWWENRLPEELFAAGPQGYLNPLPHLPFYFTYQTGASSLLIALSMALLHSVNLWLLHFIACQVAPPTNRMRAFAVVCGVILGALSPGFLYEIGTSYADVIVSIPVMGALLLILIWQAQSIRPQTNWRFLYAAGLLAGIAMGLKPTALVFCATSFLALIALSGRRAWCVAWRSIISGSTGLVITGGPHAWMLWKAFRNPVFPLFNELFRSPWFPPVSLVSNRFRPSSLEASLRFPLDMANSFKRVSFEEQVVDIRPMWLLSLAACSVLFLLIKHFRPAPYGKQISKIQNQFWLTLSLAIPLWIYSSGNIRYAIEPLLLVGPAIALLALQWVGKRHIWALLAILLPLFGQTVLTRTINQTAFQGENLSTSKTWFDISIPSPLNRTPAYYLSLQALSFSSLAPTFPPNSRFLNLIGSSNLPPDAMALQTLDNYRQTHGLPLRTLFQSLAEDQRTKVLIEEVATQNSLLSEYGYRIQEDDCTVIEWNKSNTDPISSSANNSSKKEPRIGKRIRPILISCAITQADPLTPASLARRQKTEARIEHWAQKCPETFSPYGFWSQQYPDIRKRHFPNSDVQIVELRNGDLRAIYMDNSLPMIHLEDKDGTALTEECPSKPSTSPSQ